MTMSIRGVIEIRYAQIRSLDLSNGEGVGIALFVQGCYFHCNNCFNPETWDFSSGKEWTEEVKNKFLELANRPYIKRISILGGEPLAEENFNGVLDLVNELRLSLSQKTIWLYTGFTWNEVFSKHYSKDYIITEYPEKYQIYRQEIVKKCDVLIDGKYIDSQRDITLPYRGSSNQRVINVQESLKKGEMILWKC